MFWLVLHMLDVQDPTSIISSRTMFIRYWRLPNLKTYSFTTLDKDCWLFFSTFEEGKVFSTAWGWGGAGAGGGGGCSSSDTRHI